MILVLANEAVAGVFISRFVADIVFVLDLPTVSRDIFQERGPTREFRNFRLSNLEINNDFQLSDLAPPSPGDTN